MKQSHANKLARVSLMFSYEISDSAHRGVWDKSQSNNGFDPELYYFQGLYNPRSKRARAK